MPEGVPASRIMILSKGGLISIIDLTNGKAIMDWPEELSLSGMALVALFLRFVYEYKESIITFDKIVEKSSDDMISIFYDQGHKLIKSPLWVAYVSENSDYLVVAEYKQKIHMPMIINLLRQIADGLEDIPEDSALVSKVTMKLIEKYLKSLME